MATQTLIHLAIIHSIAATGYRRANTVFCKGENKFKASDFSEAQLAQVEADPRLTLEFQNAPESLEQTAPHSPLDAGAMDTSGLVLDEPKLSFSEAVAKLDASNKDHFTNGGKPQCDVLGELMGAAISAPERDALWAEQLAREA